MAVSMLGISNLASLELGVLQIRLGNSSQLTEVIAGWIIDGNDILH